jgi:fanconi anemia group D2 protein
VNSALEVLLLLVDQYLSEIRPFSNFLQGMLDFLENLNEDQIRKVYKLLSTLSYTKLNDSEEEFNRNDSLTITVTKELTNGRMKYRRMGIIGVCAILGKLGSISSSNSLYPTHQTEHKMNKEELNHITLFLLSAFKSCVKVPVIQFQIHQ